MSTILSSREKKGLKNKPGISDPRLFSIIYYSKSRYLRHTHSAEQKRLLKKTSGHVFNFTATLKTTVADGPEVRQCIWDRHDLSLKSNLRTRPRERWNRVTSPTCHVSTHFSRGTEVPVLGIPQFRLKEGFLLKHNAKSLVPVAC